VLLAWLELGVESYTERVLIQRAAEKGDWGTLSLYQDMRFQQVHPKLLEGASGPLSSEHWEKLPGRIEALETAIKKAEAEFKTADGGSGAVEILRWIQLRDPYEQIPFALTRSDRLRPND